MRRFFLLLLPFLASTQANLLVVVPIQPSMAYDVQMNERAISIVESTSQLLVLQYAVPVDCHTSQANIYQKQRNLIFDIPCHPVLYLQSYSAVV
tara:strand:+ start:295 stop:576 length:282 start_codon:yes stop_codon:yes gene_type:complete